MASGLVARVVRFRVFRPRKNRTMQEEEDAKLHPVRTLGEQMGFTASSAPHRVQAAENAAAALTDQSKPKARRRPCTRPWNKRNGLMMRAPALAGVVRA